VSNQGHQNRGVTVSVAKDQKASEKNHTRKKREIKFRLRGGLRQKTKGKRLKRDRGLPRIKKVIPAELTRRK